jgi:hypothetical protein
MLFLHKIGRIFSHPKLLFYALPWLMFLVVLGTVTQKELGLYEATEKYFNSIVLWLGPIPTPGGLLTIGIIFVALCIKFIFYSPWKFNKAGTILTHLGVLLLLLGGIITATNAKEGFMIIPEGRNVNAVSDYFKRVLVLQKNGKTIEVFDFDALSKNQTLNAQGLEINILEKCVNCGVRAPTGIHDNLEGLAEHMEPFPTAEEKQKEANFSGLILGIQAPQDTEFGTYIVMEDVPKNPEFTMNDDTLSLVLQRQNESLPFSITLNDFRKIDYPGTKKAREYESDLVIHDGDIAWPTTISMNQPLRYKGYTFYQSSFDQRANMEVTVLNVVQNKGRLFPYIATFVIFIGILLHLIIHLQSRPKENNKGNNHA